MAIGIEMGRDITLLGYFGIYLHEGVLTNVGALKGIDHGPKQLWDFEKVLQWVVWVFILSLFFLGFNMKGLWWCSYSTTRSWD
jgi:hypothetical protein